MALIITIGLILAFTGTLIYAVKEITSIKV